MFWKKKHREEQDFQPEQEATQPVDVDPAPDFEMPPFDAGTEVQEEPFFMEDPTLGENDDTTVDTTPETSLWVDPLIVGEPFATPEGMIPSLGDNGNESSSIADTVIDGWSSEYFGMRMACSRGQSHRYSGTPRQDMCRWALCGDGKYLIAAVADGVSSAQYAHVAADFATRYAIAWLKKQLAEQTVRDDPSTIPWEKLVQAINYELMQRETRLAEKAAAAGELEPPKGNYATTLGVAVCASTPEGMHVFGGTAGDSPVWLLENNRVEVLSGHKEHEENIAVNKVKALPAPEEGFITFSSFVPADKNVAVMVVTDGVADAMGEGGGELGALFEEALLGDRKASLIEFARLVDFSKRTYDDDRSAIAIWNNAPRISE